MSNWVHIDCVFRQRNSGSTFGIKDYHTWHKEYRKIILKKFYKALSKINRIKGISKGWDRDLRFSIQPEFISKYNEKRQRFEYNDVIVANIYGDIRWDSNEDKHFTELIKEIWYKSDLSIDSGVCVIREDYSPYLETFIYDNNLKEILLFKDNFYYELYSIQYHVKKFKMNEEEGWFKINSKVYKIDEIFEKSEYYTKLFQSMGIPIRIFNK